MKSDLLKSDLLLTLLFGLLLHPTFSHEQDHKMLKLLYLVTLRSLKAKHALN